MEFKVWVDGVQRVICGVNGDTTCRDIVLCLAQATHQFGKFVLIEKWRNNERLLAPNEFPIQILNKWAEYSDEVCFIMRRSEHHQQIQQRILQMQQQQQVYNEPIYGQIRPMVYTNSSSTLINSNINKQTNKFQHQNFNPVSGVNNNLVYKNIARNNFNSPTLDVNNQQIYSCTKYNSPVQLSHNNFVNQQNINPQLYQQMQSNTAKLTLQQPNIQQSIYGTTMRSNFLPVQMQQNSSKILYNNPLNHVNNNLLVGQSANNLQKIICRQNVSLENYDTFKGRPKCPPPYNEAIAKSSLVNNNSPVNISTSHSPIYQQQQINYYNQSPNQDRLNNINKLNTVVSPNDNILTPSPNHISNHNIQFNNKLYNNNNLVSSNNNTSNNHVNIRQLRSKFDNDQNSELNINRKNFETSFYEKENRNEKRIREAMKVININNNNIVNKITKKENLELNEENDLLLIKKEGINAFHDFNEFKQSSLINANKLSEHINRSIDTNEQLESLQKETERIEFEKNQIAQNINETDLKIAKCRKKIQILIDEIKDTSLKKENEMIKLGEEIALKQIGELKEKIFQSVREYEKSSEKLTTLQKELDQLETSLNERKKKIEQLTNDIKEANIEGLTLVPLEDMNGNVLEDENKSPYNLESCETVNNQGEHRFNYRLGSTRRISGCPRELGNAVPTNKNPHGVWV